MLKIKGEIVDKIIVKDKYGVYDSFITL